MKTIRNLIVSLLVIIAGFTAFYKIENYYNKNSALVYFLKNGRNSNVELVGIKIKVKPENKLEEAIKALLKGPDKKTGYFSEIPVKTRLLGIKKFQERIIINLSKDFQTGGGSFSMEWRLKQLIYTSVGAAKSKAVYLEINGEKVKYLGGEGVEISQPLLKY